MIVKKNIVLICCLMIAVSGGISETVLAGGLSQEVAQKAECEERLTQCMDKVKQDIPCRNITISSCRSKRYASEKQCHFLYSHCFRGGPPVKGIMPVRKGKKLY